MPQKPQYSSQAPQQQYQPSPKQAPRQQKIVQPPPVVAYDDQEDQHSNGGYLEAYQSGRNDIGSGGSVEQDDEEEEQVTQERVPCSLCGRKFVPECMLNLYVNFSVCMFFQNPLIVD